MNDTTQQKRFDRAVLVGLNASVLTPEENATEEIHGGAGRPAGDGGGHSVWGSSSRPRTRPDPRTFIGEGKVAEVKELAPEPWTPTWSSSTTPCPPLSSGR